MFLCDCENVADGSFAALVPVLYLLSILCLPGVLLRAVPGIEAEAGLQQEQVSEAGGGHPAGAGGQTIPPRQPRTLHLLPGV